MIVCNRCSKENQDHYKFCLGCGAELTSPVKPGQDIGAMKTMMADASSFAPPGGAPRGGPTPAPFGGGHMPGAPAPMPPPPGPPMGHVPMAPAPMPPGMGPQPGMGGFGQPQPPPPGMGGFGQPAPPPPMGPPMGGPMGPPPPMGPPMGGPMGGPLGPPGPMSGPMGAQGPGPMPMGPPPGVPAPGFGAPPSAPAAAAGPKRCPQCNSDVPPNFRFCGACGFRMDELSGAQPMPQPPAPMPMPVAPPQPRATLTLIRPDGSEGGVFELKQGKNEIGRQYGQIFENDGYLSPTHAELTVSPTGGHVKDLGSLNGVFVKMTSEEEIRPGQVFRIGQELLRFDLVTPPEPMPDGTEVMGSPNPGYWGKVTVIIGKDVDGSAFPLLGESVTIGRERGEINFPDDGYVSGLHAKVSTRDGRVFLTDLGSSNGTFFKIASERSLTNESFVLLGQQLFRLNL